MLVADDHPIYREGIVRAINDRPDLELVGEAGDGRQALDGDPRPRARRSRCSTSACPGSTAPRCWRRCAATGSSTEVLFLSAFMEPELAYKTVAARRQGLPVEGVLAPGGLRGDRLDRARRRPPSPPRRRPASPQQIQERERSGGPPKLTDREQEVLDLVAQGSPRPTSASTSTSRPRPSRATCTRSTRSSASPTAPPPSPRRCGAGCSSSEHGRGLSRRERAELRAESSPSCATSSTPPPARRPGDGGRGPGAAADRPADPRRLAADACSPPTRS